MFKNKSHNGQNNICGKRIYEIRKCKVPKMSQRMLAEKLQLLGIDVDKNAIQRIESGQRFVTDIELQKLAEALHVSVSQLYGEDDAP